MMQGAIKNFHTQFLYEPVIENRDKLQERSRFILVGMGGSHLAGDIIKIWDPALPLTMHSDYGLPDFSSVELEQSTIILNSYSGNTEEVLDAYKISREKNLSMVCISVGGRLLLRAEADGIPYIKLPNQNIQPRLAIGLNIKAILTVMRNDRALREVSDLANLLRPMETEAGAKNFAERLKGHIPIIYTSRRNAPLALYWKVMFNESAKIPSFWNYVPELNHNEMTGFDVRDSTKKLSENVFFLILRDPEDHPQVLKRIKLFEMILRKRGFSMEIFDLKNELQFYKAFSSILFVAWASHYLAESYGIDSESVPMVEEFKQLL